VLIVIGAKHDGANEDLEEPQEPIKLHKNKPTAPIQQAVAQFQLRDEIISRMFLFCREGK